MKSPPKFVRGACRAAMRIALEEIVLGRQAQMRTDSAGVGNSSSCCRGCSCSDHFEEVSSRNRVYSTDSPNLLEVCGRSC